MRAWANLLVGFGVVAVPVKAAQPSAVPRSTSVTDAAKLCVVAISPSGVDSQVFEHFGWKKVTVESGNAGDQFFAKAGVHISLSVRPSVGGSCIVSYKVNAGYDLPDIAAGLVKALPATPITGNPSFVMLRVPQELIVGRIQDIPNGRLVSIQFEISRN